MSGSGTSEDPYVIVTSTDLNNVRNDLSAYYILNNDIDMSSYGNWVPYSTATSAFNGFYGNFNGNGHKIIGLYCSRGNYSSMFGNIMMTANIYDLALVDVEIIGGLYTGAFIARAILIPDDPSPITYLSRCYATGTVTGSSQLGGLAGYIAGCQINNCFSAVAVSGNYASRIGGISGRGSTSSYCYFIGTIDTNNEPTYYGEAIGADGNENHSYYDITLNSNINAGSATGLTTAQMKDSANYSGWDFDTIWICDENYNDGYPYLRVFIQEVGTTGQIKVYTAGSFEAKPIKWYNGSSWITKPLKVWNGTSWEETGY